MSKSELTITFATVDSKPNVPLIPVEVVMAPLVAAIDGLRIFRIGKRSHLSLDTAITWTEREITRASHPSEVAVLRERLEGLRKIEEQLPALLAAA